MLIFQCVDKKLIKFLLVGLINTAVGAGVMFILYNLVNFNYWISSASNYIVGGIVSFFLNKYFTFKNHEKSLKQVLYFILTLAVCYVLSYLIAKRVVYMLLSTQSEKLRDNISMLTGMCLYTILNYFGQRLFVFAKKEVNNE